MNCPICGKELPDKAKKCSNCGCRPKHLYGRPKPPKWMFATALALVVIVLVVSVAALPFLSPPDPVVNTSGETTPETVPEPETQPEPEPAPVLKSDFWDLSLRQSGNSKYIDMDYLYDGSGNLIEVIEDDRARGAAVANPIYILFSYDEHGIFTGFQQKSGGNTNYTGQVSYDEEQHRVEVTTLLQGVVYERYTFQYDEQNRLASLSIHRLWHGSQNRWDLSYNSKGQLHTYTMWWGTEKNGLEKHRVYTMQYTAGGELFAYTEEYVSSPQVDTCYCSVDDQGNVLHELYPDLVTENSYTYTTQTVTDRTAWQYELQMYLLFARDMGPDRIVLPIIKTPFSQ